MKKLILCFVSFCLIYLPAYSQCGFTAGNENPGYITPANYGANYILGTKYNVPVDGMLVSLNLFGLGTNSNVQMCLYEDNGGVPGNLITTSAAGVVTNGVIALAVTPVFLPAGDYWQMAIFDNAGGTSNHCYYTTTTTQTVYYTSLAFGSSMPANASGFLNYCCQDFQYWMVFGGNDSFSNISEIACETYTAPSGAVYSASGIYNDTIPNTVGCDSIITIDLTINSADVSVSQTGADLSSDVVGASYQWLDCDNAYAIVAGATNQNYTAVSNGNYAVEITENGCTDTSVCLFVNGLGLENIPETIGVTVYPNPTSGSITIVTDKMYDVVTMTIFDISGRLITSEMFYNGSNFNLEFEGEAGTYVLVIQTPAGEISRVTLVKE